MSAGRRRPYRGFAIFLTTIGLSSVLLGQTTPSTNDVSALHQQLQVWKFK